LGFWRSQKPHPIPAIIAQQFTVRLAAADAVQVRHAHLSNPRPLGG
jgi:hypothetical protein